MKKNEKQINRMFNKYKELVRIWGSEATKKDFYELCFGQTKAKLYVKGEKEIIPTPEQVIANLDNIEKSIIEFIRLEKLEG